MRTLEVAIAPDELVRQVAQMLLAEDAEAIEYLGPRILCKLFGRRIQIWGPGSDPLYLYVLGHEDCVELLRVLPVEIDDQVRDRMFVIAGPDLKKR